MAETEMDTGTHKDTMVNKGENTEWACTVYVGQRWQSLIRPSEHSQGELNNAVRFPFITTDLPVWPPNLCHRQYVSQPRRHPVRPTPPSFPLSSLKSVSATLSADDPQIILFLNSRCDKGRSSVCAFFIIKRLYGGFEWNKITKILLLQLSNCLSFINVN